jgi:hypothetical protein
LLLFLAINLAIPLDAFLDGGLVWRYVVRLTLGPMYFAGVIFAHTFREARRTAPSALTSRVRSWEVSRVFHFAWVHISPSGICVLRFFHLEAGRKSPSRRNGYRLETEGAFPARL